MASATGGWQRAAGYEGDAWGEGQQGGTPVVLTDTVTTAAVGPWRAVGLARNESDAALGGLLVSATLTGSDGAVLETITAASPVRGVRPGEPVPFELVGTTDAAGVASVRWEVRPDPEVAERTDELVSARELRLATYWTRSSDRVEQVDFYLHRDAPDGPRPYLLFGSVQNLGATVPSPQLVGAWRSADGRIVAVAQSPLATGDALPAAALSPGTALDGLLTVDDPASVLTEVVPMLWGTGS